MTNHLMILTLNWGSVCLDSLLSSYSSLLYIQYSLEGNQYAKPTLKQDRVLSSIFLREEYLYKLFRILLYRRFVYSSPSIYLSNHLFTSVWTHGYLLCILSIIQYYTIYFVLEFYIFDRWKLFLLATVSFSYNPTIFCIFIVGFFLSTLLSDSFYIPCHSPRIHHFSKHSWFLLLENSIRK